MCSNRIQKLLFSEYSDFEDIVLIESSFAETSRGGKGVRQVQIGLTPGKLVLASYHMEALDEWQSQESQRGRGRRGHDVDLESFELVSAYPVECVNLSVFRHRKRQVLKARFCNGKVAYYELGGWHERKMLWSIWCERIKFLSPYDSRTSVSETSVATSGSSTGSSLFIVRSSLLVSGKGQPTLWCHYGSSNSHQDQGSWVDPHVYLGPSFPERAFSSVAIPEIGKGNRCKKRQFGKLKAEITEKTVRLSERHERIAEEAVGLWESQSSSKKSSRRIHRRYGFHPFPHLLDGVGLWQLPKPQAFTLQVKKSASLVHLPHDSPVQLALPKAQLVRTASLENLEVPALCPDKLMALANINLNRERLEFWSGDEDCRLEWSRKQYRLQQRHMRMIRRHMRRYVSNTSVNLKNKRKSRKQSHTSTVKDSNMSEVSEVLSAHGGGGDYSLALRHRPSPWNVTWHRGNSSVSEWRGPAGVSRKMSSSSLAHQLAMVDKDLFLKITTLELGRLRKDMNSCRATHLRAVVSFSFRTSCLVATQILAGTSVKERAVLIVKFVGVAYKCHKLQSLQSAVSVLHGLQSPAVYRLHHSWSYVRRHHASKYRRFEDLSKRYLDPRLPLYQRTYDELINTPPHIPSIEMLVAVLLHKIRHLPATSSSTLFSTECSSECMTSPVSQSLRPLRSLRGFLSAISITAGGSLPHSQPSMCRSETHIRALSTETLMDNLDKFFAPVSVSSPERRHLQDIEYFLDNHQAAAKRYAIPTDRWTRAFLLFSRYEQPANLFTLSKTLES